MIRRPAGAFWHPLVFGASGGGHVYRPRRSAYLVAHDEQGRLACEEGLHGGLYLVGGGLGPGESPEDALVREVREEAGAQIVQTRFIGILRELVVAPNGREAHDQAAYFFVGRLVEQATPPPTNFVWASRRRFLDEAVYSSHEYAVTHLGSSPPRPR